MKYHILYKTNTGTKSGGIEYKKDLKHDKVFIATTSGGQWILKKNIISITKVIK